MRSFKISVVKVLTLLVAMLMLGTSTFAQVSVTFPNVSGVVGATGTGAITVGDLTDQKVSAFEFTLYYDKTIFEISSASRGTLIDGVGNFEMNPDIANGKIRVAWAGAEALKGSGTLVNLTFNYKAAGGPSPLSFTTTGGAFKFNSGVPAYTEVAGSVIVPQIVLEAAEKTFRAGQTIRIPILVSPITEVQNVRSYNFVATYNKDIISITGKDIANSLSELGSVEINTNTPGTLTLAWAGASRIMTKTSVDTLIYLTGTAIAKGSTGIVLSNVKMNGGVPIAAGNTRIVTVSAANVAPTLTTDPVGPAFTAIPGQQLKITLKGTDANSDALVYGVVGNPATSVLTNGVFTWTPTLADRKAELYSFKFTVTDNFVATPVEYAVTVSVPVNAAPTLAFAPVGPAYTIDALKELKITLTGADTNPEDVLSLEITSADKPEGSVLDKGIFTWTPTLAQRKADAYSFSFVVKDQAGLSTTYPVTVKVTANVAPKLTTDPVGTAFTIADGDAFKLTVAGTDDNAEDVASLQYTTSKLPGTATFKDKVFTWTPTVAERSATPYAVTFTVTDQAGLKTDVIVNITVSQNVAPTLTLNPATAQTVNENQKVTITLVGDDKNKSDVAKLTYTITKPSPVPTGAAIAGNVFTWTPNYDQSSATAYAFEFTVTDQGGLTGKATVNITVVNVPRAPVFTKEPPYEVVPVVVVDPKWGSPKPYTFQYVANSPDGKAVLFSLIAGPSNSSITSDGVFTWTPLKEHAGKVYTVTVQATDGTLTTNSTQLLAAGNTIVGVEQYSGVPTEYNLFQNYPNPFNPTTSIQVALPKDGNVKLTVYSILGEEVAVLANKYMPAGYHRFTFDASRLNSGMYLYRIEANGYVSVKKMLLVK